MASAGSKSSIGEACLATAITTVPTSVGGRVNSTLPAARFGSVSARARHGRSSTVNCADGIRRRLSELDAGVAGARLGMDVSTELR